MIKSCSKYISCLLICVSLIFSSTIIEAGSASVTTPDIPITEQAITKFVDEIVSEQMEKYNIPGFLAAAVLGEEILFSKGYGTAGITSQNPMDPAASVFRAASLSKPFTAAALMQLAEQGLIDVDADINQYLVGMQIPDTYPQHISVGHLLTHTSGFDELSLAVRFDDPERLSSLYEDVRDSMPARVRPPGEILSYSNYGYTLAGYIVESVTGMLFEDYIEAYIFKPLGMNKSSFHEPIPASLAEDLVAMHTHQGEEQVELPVLYNNLRPSGSVYSTIEDIARFASAQLNSGSYGGNSILSPESLDLMQNTQFTHDSYLEGWGYGLSEINKHGLRVIGHAGDFNGGHTLLFMIPSAEFAMVLYYNSNTNTVYEQDPRNVIMEGFIDAFFPEHSLNRPVTVDTTPPEATDITGYYQTTRYTQKTPGKFLMPNMFAQLIVTQDERGHVFVNMPMGMVEPTEWIPYKEGIFVRADRETYLSYRLNERGNVDYLFYNMGGAAATAIQRTQWYEIYWVIFGFIAFSLIIFIITLLAWLTRTVIRKIRRKKKILRTDTLRYANLLSRLISVIGLIFLVLIGVMTVHVMATLNSPLLFMLPVISLGGWLIAIASIVLLALSLKIWRNKEDSLAGRLLLTLVPIAGMALTWILYLGNMLKFTTL